MLCRSPQSNNIKSHFPILQRKVAGKKLIYLDNAATTQVPTCVIDAIVNYYTQTHANIHRGIHHLANHATQKVEEVRTNVQQFLHATSPKEIIFTTGTNTCQHT